MTEPDGLVLNVLLHTSQAYQLGSKGHTESYILRGIMWETFMQLTWTITPTLLAKKLLSLDTYRTGTLRLGRR